LPLTEVFIKTIHSYPINTEVKTVKTYISIPPTGFTPMPSSSTTLPAAYTAGAVTFEMNTSFILLPATPMAKRKFDPRVGYFADDYTVYSDEQQKVEDNILL